LYFVIILIVSKIIIFLSINQLNNYTSFYQIKIANILGAASSQEQLAVAAQNAVSTIIQLADVVKFGAASLGANNPEAQVGVYVILSYMDVLPSFTIIDNMLINIIFY